ncbi:hypothetical protein EDC01DRAFT_223034 [Geopyxis carbonaria]|nr:hypothetical protein EDC01DRAFT_223034 [Geopyxis carbonaria]
MGVCCFLETMLFGCGLCVFMVQCLHFTAPAVQSLSACMCSQFCVSHAISLLLSASLKRLRVWSSPRHLAAQTLLGSQSRQSGADRLPNGRRLRPTALWSTYPPAISPTSVFGFALRTPTSARRSDTSGETMNCSRSKSTSRP